LANKRKLSPEEGDAAREEATEAQEAEQTDDIEYVKKALEEAKEQAEKYMGNWQRAEADFANYKRRNEQERAELISFANANLMTDLLPALDDLERALDNVSGDFDVAGWVEGIKLIYRKLKTVLQDHGLAEIEAVGREFDPNFHEAVMCVEGEEGKVCEEIQRGYKLRDRLLRPSMVAVGKEREETESAED
jgi:molecular chaperone GrpE